MQEHKIFLSEQYVERETEKNLVLEAIAKKHSGVIIFEGDRGVGKTSLMFALFLMLEKMENIKPFVVSLFPYKAVELEGRKNAWLNQESPFNVKNLNELLQKVTTYWGIKDIPSAGDEARREYFARGLASAQEKTTPVLLIDSIYECEDATRLALEEYLVTPLASSGTGFIILSGRGKAPVWLRPELRQEPVLLQKFEQSQTLELLKKIGSPHLDKLEVIHRLSAGYPLLARLLGAAKEQPEEYLDKAIDILIQETLTSKMPPGEEYRLIRTKLEKLAVIPTVFRSMEVENYLFIDEEIPQRRARTSEFVNFLLGSHIMKYKNGGYTINQSISAPLREYLKLPPNLETRQGYQTLLASNYDALAKRYSEAKEYYEGLKTGLQSA